MVLRVSHDTACPELIEPAAARSLPRSQHATILFVDMVGSTARFRQMMPQEVLSLLRHLMVLLRECVVLHGGVVDKFLGDGLMAVFGVPLPGAMDAANAAQCAFAILRCIDAWNERRRRSGDAAIRVAIGIHCGPVVQGDIGGNDRAELAVVGDTVNIARRVETCCRTLDAGMLVTAAFIESLHEGGGDLAARFADFGWHRLRDCGDPIHLHGVGRPLPIEAANYTSV